MPTTINGIGTRYVGKSNPSVRTDTCRHCDRVSVLSSYDTRLWFVIGFIPVIPLGRKRIVDSCASCGLHVAIKADAYEHIRQDRMAEALTRFRGSPSAESALAGHATMLAFQDSEKAAWLRRDALARFPNQVELLSGLAYQLDEIKEHAEAAPLHEALLRITPDLPSARAGVARKKMAEGRLDDARSLLSFLEVAGAGRKHSLDPLKALATHYQEMGRHSEALRISETLLREDPAMAQDRSFRSLVTKSEGAQGSSQSILPRRKHSLLALFGVGGGTGYARWQTRTALFGTLTLFAAAGLLISNEYFRRNRSIHVANATGEQILAQVDEAHPLTLNDLGRLVVIEGHHRVKLTGPVDETHEVDVQTRYVDRWLNKPVWVLNPGKEAVLEESTIHYALNARPPDQRLIVGQSFLFRPHVDYAFEPPPESLKVKGKSKELTKSSLQLLRGQDVRAFDVTVENDRATALAFAENRLRRAPQHGELLKSYLDAATAADLARMQAFLKTGLDRRPVLVPWHRAYQSFSEFDGHEDDLVALYDQFLIAEPANGSLLYLRGRIEPDWDRRDRLFRRASEANPRLPWPWLALGMQAETGAHWDEAVRSLRKAQELKIPRDQVSTGLQTARLGTGDAKGLATDLKAYLSSHPFEVGAILSLAEALAAAGEPDKIEREVTGWHNRVASTMPPEIPVQVRAVCLYYAGKLQDCADRCAAVPALKSGALRVQSLLALKKSKDVTSDPSFAKVLEDPRMALAVSLGLYVENQPEEAARWRERAIRNMEPAPRDLQQATTILKSAKPVPAADLERVNVDPEFKALILALLAERFPAQRAEYVALAGRFNVRRRPPYYLVRNAIERKRPS